jgi:PAS domain S-box-containing protein
MSADDAPQVLVVDDNPVTRYATGRVLQAAGLRTLDAGTGAEAVALAHAGLAAVVLDVHLPDFDGFEVCRRLRTQPDTARLPVVYLSAAHVRDLDKVKGLESGADAYMTHPAEPALLVATVRTLMRARTAEDAMRLSEARFRAIYDQALNGIALIDEQGCFVDANPAMLALLQQPAAAVVGQPLRAFAPEGEGERVSSALREAALGPWHGEFALRAADGRAVLLDWNLLSHIEPGVTMAVAIDVSEHRALDQQRQDLLEREQAARADAERLSRSKDELIAVLSHELRTPLNAILGWVHVLRRGDAAAGLARGLEVIERNARMQGRLIADILDMSRMDVGKLRLELEQVDVAELAQAAVTALGGPAADKKVTIAVDVQQPLRPQRADPGRLQQVIWNLLTNAIKFSAPGGCIRLSLRQDEQQLQLAVQDEGQGIEPAFLPFLFDRFSQGDAASNRRHGGLGLGLSIVKHLVDLHGGTISAHSKGLEHGATFTVTLPLQAPAASSDGPPDSVFGALPGSAGDAAEPVLRGLHVLTVEDDTEAREMLAIILRDHGARVSSASSCAQALHALEGNSFDVLVSDIGLPGADGYALMREVRQREAGSAHRLPAIALTAFTRTKDQQLALAAGFDAHCAKPLRPHELIAAIREAVRAGEG